MIIMTNNQSDKYMKMLAEGIKESVIAIYYDIHGE